MFTHKPVSLMQILTRVKPYIYVNRALVNHNNNIIKINHYAQYNNSRTLASKILNTLSLYPFSVFSLSVVTVISLKY